MLNQLLANLFIGMIIVLTVIELIAAFLGRKP